MPRIHEDFLTVYYDRDELQLVIANEHTEHVAHNVSVDVGGGPVYNHPGCGLMSEPENRITLFPGDTHAIPFERTQKGPSESYMTRLIYYDEKGDQHTEDQEIQL